MPLRPRFVPLAALLLAAPLLAQRAPAARPDTATTIVTRQYGDLAAGPYKRLVIRNAMVVPGHGGPTAGP